MAAPLGILLAAGRGRRFSADGRDDKLLQRLPDGRTLALASAQHMLAVMPAVLAVVRPGADVLASLLVRAGCQVTVCPQADAGMGASLAHAVRQGGDAGGWLVALADMPFVQPATILALVEAWRGGASIAAPALEGRRGNPVVFGAAHRDFLAALTADEGARSLLAREAPQLIAVADRGILRDIDTPADLP